jgi:hypothetical protein
LFKHLNSFFGTFMPVKPKHAQGDVKKAKTHTTVVQGFFLSDNVFLDNLSILDDVWITNPDGQEMSGTILFRNPGWLHLINIDLNIIRIIIIGIVIDIWI